MKNKPFKEAYYRKIGETEIKGPVPAKDAYLNRLKYKDREYFCECGATSYPRKGYERKDGVIVDYCFFSKNHDKNCDIKKRTRRITTQEVNVKAFDDLANYKDGPYIPGRKGTGGNKPKNGGEEGEPEIDPFGGNETEEEKDKKLSSSKSAFNEVIELLVEDPNNEFARKTLVDRLTIMRILKENNGTLEGTRRLIVLRKTYPSFCDPNLTNPDQYFTCKDVFTANNKNAVFIQFKIEEETHRHKFFKDAKNWDDDTYIVIYGKLIKNKRYPDKQLYSCLLTSKTCKKISKKEYEKAIAKIQ